MSESAHKPCYGTMFPPTLEFRTGKSVSGKVFGLQLIVSDGVVRGERRMTQDLAAWDDCLKCPEFQHCYKLCLAQLLLETAISED